MIRRCVIIVMTLAMLLNCMTPASASGLTKAERYDAAVTELRNYLNDEGTMSLDDLFMAFSMLGSYEQSAMFAVYTNALRNVEKGEYSRVYYYISSLQVNEEFCTFLEEDGALGSIGKLEAYARARQAEQDGDIAAALKWYKECSSFMDSFARMMALQDNLLADKYQQAMTYYMQDTYEGYQRAYELFLELSAYGGYENSNELMAMAALLRATPVPTATPMPTPTATPKNTATPAPTATSMPTPMPQTPSLELQQALENRLQFCTFQSSYAFSLQQDGTVQVYPNLKASAISSEEQRVADEIAKWRDIVAFDVNPTACVGLKKDGSVVYFSSWNQSWASQIGTLKDIVDIVLLSNGVAGLKKDGTVLYNGLHSEEYDTSDWRDIVDIEAGAYHLVGLKADGTVVATGSNDFGECDTRSWRNIVAIVVHTCTTAGLRADGTVVAVGWNEYGQCNVSDWRNIIQIDSAGSSIAGLRSDGTVVISGLRSIAYNWWPFDVQEWKNIVAIDLGSNSIVGLKADGTAIAPGPHYNYPKVRNWHDIVAVCTDDYSNVFGIQRDGTVVYETGVPQDYSYDLSACDLFD